MDLNYIKTRLDNINLDEEDEIIEKNLNITRELTVSSNNLAIYKRIKKTKAFAPYNKAALDFELNLLKFYHEKRMETMKYKFPWDDESSDAEYMYHLTIRFFNEIKIKKSGTVKLSKDILIYTIKNNTLIPLNDNSQKELWNISILRNKSPRENIDLWNKLNVETKGFIPYLNE